MNRLNKFDLGQAASLLLLLITCFFSIKFLPSIAAVIVSLIFFSLLPIDVILFVLLLNFIVSSSELIDAYRSILNLLGIGFIIFYTYRGIVKETLHLVPVPKLVLSFILFITVSTFFSGIFSIDVNEGLSATFRQTIFFVLVYLLFVITNSNKKVLFLLSIPLVGISILSSSLIVSVFQYGIVNYLKFEGIVRFQGLYGNFNALAGLAVIATPIGIMLYLVMKKSSPIASRTIFALFIFFTFLTIILTNSRAALLGSLAAVAVFFAIVNLKLFIKTIISSFSFLGLLILIPKVQESLLFYLRIEHLMNLRDHLWSISINALSEHPILGIGPGTLKQYFYKYLPVPLGSFDEVRIGYLKEVAGSAGLSHNFFLFRATELGIPGIISAALLPYIFFYYCHKAIKRSKNVNRTLYLTSVAITGAGAGMFIRGFFESIGLLTYGWIMIDLPFWLCMIAIIYIAERADLSDEPIAAIFKK